MIRAAASPSVYVGAILRGLPRRADSPRGFAAFYGRRRLRGSAVSQSAVDAIAAAIQKQEGYAPGTLAYVNNNPGNLVYVGQPGASPGAGGFASFGSYSLGLQALENQIQLDATRGTDVNGNPTATLAQLITSWAPPSQNDTAAYISNVSAWTGFDPNAPLSSLGTSGGASLSFDTSGSGGSTSSDPGFDLTDLLSSGSGDGSFSDAGSGFSFSLPLLVGGGVLGVILLSRIL